MLHVHRAERADRLAAGLAEVLREPPGDPFTAEVIAVPARGVERWLAQRLSHSLGAAGPGRDGVCANVRFVSPTDLVEEAMQAATGVDPGEDPWRRDRMLWTLLDVIDDCADEPWAAALAGHVGAQSAGRRFTTAQHLAQLYDSYGSYRPAMLRAWVDGEDGDGAGVRLEEELRWQAELWRALRRRIGTPSRAERLPAAADVLRSGPELLDLPERLSIFGPTRLAADALTVIAALAARRDVHLWLPHASPALWARVAVAVPTAAPRRRADPTADVPRHPLLASLGRDARELQIRLHGCGVLEDHYHSGPEPPPTVLGRLQTRLRDDEAPRQPGGFDPADRSVSVHACHGPARQVEVLREVLLGLLAADDTLEPRDVLVMCPDIETFAPLITATFGAEEFAAGSHPGHRLRVRLADRSLRQTNPLLATIAQLLDLADARVTASQVLDLAASAPVRRRFRLHDDDLERMRDWVARSGVRWGLDAPSRAPFALDKVAQNTWQAGLDRVLLGAAMSEDDDRWLGLALPLDDVDSSDIDLAGRLAELVDRLAVALRGLTGEQPLADWLAALLTALDALTDVPESEVWQLAQARHELGRVAEGAGERAGELSLTLADVRALLAGRLQGRPTRANFRTGSLTMCSMVPMRSVPHRVICLLGLDEEAFPRHPSVDGDDILARDPRVGERDGRSEDRQLLLDAIMAAQEHLVVLYTGADDRTNASRPPAVPIGELLDALRAVAGTASDRIVVRHPLQPFDPRNFIAGALGAPGAFSFDRPSLAGATAASGPRSTPGAFLAAPLPMPAGSDIELETLIRFLEHPVRGFLRQRLGVTVLGEDEEIADALSVQLDPLQKWAIGDRLLAARLAGADPAACRQAEWRRGALPPGALGGAVLDELLGEVEPLLRATAEERATPPRSVDIAVQLDAGRVLGGTVAGIRGSTLLRVIYSRLGPKHRLRAWVQALALAAAWPDEPWRAVTVGRAGPGRVKRSTVEPVEPGRARAVLAELIDLYSRGLREPLPLPVKPSAAYAEQRLATVPTGRAQESAARQWDGAMGESTDHYHQLVWGTESRFDLLLAGPPAADETWYADEQTRFGALSRRLWEPLLAAETMDTP